MTPKQKKRLNDLHDDYQGAEARLQMAIQTLRGAQEHVTRARSRFESVVEFVGGVGATWTHSPEAGVAVFETAAPLPASEPVPQNGAGPPVPHYNHQTRRAAKKALGK